MSKQIGLFALPPIREDLVFPLRGWETFVVFNNRALTFEPVENADISEVTVKPETVKDMRSQAWSCNAEWFFIFCDTGILMLNVYSDAGLFCSKLSARFIETFLEWVPERRKRKRSKQKGQPQ